MIIDIDKDELSEDDASKVQELYFIGMINMIAGQVIDLDQLKIL